MLVSDYDIFDFHMSVLEGEDEERQQVEQLALNSFFVITRVAQLVHYILQILLVVHEVRGEFEIWAVIYLWRESSDPLLGTFQLLSVLKLLVEAQHAFSEANAEDDIL